MVDYYSRFIEIVQLSNLTSSLVVSKLKTLFARHGIPETVVSDNATQFSSSEFQDFARSWNFCHVTSSPHFPQSNGQAESSVKIAKSILAQDEPALALLAYRSTPLPTLSLSPAELAFGRRIRTTLPTLSKTLMPVLLTPLMCPSVTLQRRRSRNSIMTVVMVFALSLPCILATPSSSKQTKRRNGRIQQKSSLRLRRAPSSFNDLMVPCSAAIGDTFVHVPHLSLLLPPHTR
ncbi:hypothetical protein BaRGS_00035798 [Batillaria attramentaria]|uniref:Integrase catalytic domain-containing protein n=1 Tax=Batillaria attramentaria TaxID=370345 RepID=A0ABD0JDG5_9CAEN